MLKKVIRATFNQRRKTLVNTVSASMGISKEVLRNALAEENLSETVRSENLNMAQLGAIWNRISKKEA